MVDSKKIEEDVLKHIFPMLREDEILLACSCRKPGYFSGAMTLFIGIFLVEQGFANMLIRLPVYTVVILIAGILCAWTGYWAVFLSKREYIFVTNYRIVHCHADFLGRMSGKKTESLLADISRSRLFRDAGVSQETTSGQISIQLKGRRSSLLLPNSSSAVVAFAELNKAVQRIRNGEGLEG